MKNLFFVLVTLLSFTAFTSCQKEIILNNPTTDTTSSGGGNIPPSTNGDLVVKVYGKAPTGLDSNVSYYTYNSSKKVISRRILIYINGQSNDTWDWYERNGAGLIIKSKQYQVTSTNPFPADTAVTFHHYTTGATPVLQSSISSVNFFGTVISDSIAYTYNSAGRVAKSENFQNGLFSTTLDLAGRDVFTYDANGNCTKAESFSIASGTVTLSTTQTFTFDNKTEPLKYSDAEAFIISQLPSSKNNLLTFNILNATTGSININNTYSYTYNSAGKPATSKLITVLSGAFSQTSTTNFTVYYQ